MADTGHLKIIVAGTPKAGNTWIRHLLAAVYELPMVELQADFNANDWATLGPRWVGQQHYHPQRKLHDVSKEQGIFFVTPIRHPGDILVSLRAHLQNLGNSGLTDPFPSMLEDPQNVYGEHSRQFVASGFFFLLHMSLSWLKSGWAVPVRYEDLWRNPVDTLRSLTAAIIPMPVQRLRHAICSCEIDLMQSTYDAQRNFVRKSGLGSWVEVLPAEIRSLLETRPPYADQLAAFGYTMNPFDPSNTRSLQPATVEHSLRGRTKFANGISIAPILIRAYFDLPEASISRWPDLTADGEDSFFSWLNRPASEDPTGGRLSPVITELACYLRSLRPDVAKAFPDPFGTDRIEFAHWFIYNATQEYNFDCTFTFPILRSWAQGTTVPIESAWKHDFRSARTG